MRTVLTSMVIVTLVTFSTAWPQGRSADWPELFTVDLLVRYVTWKLQSGRGAAATAPASPSPIVRSLHSTIHGARSQ